MTRLENFEPWLSNVYTCALRGRDVQEAVTFQIPGRQKSQGSGCNYVVSRSRRTKNEPLRNHKSYVVNSSTTSIYPGRRPRETSLCPRSTDGHSNEAVIKMLPQSLGPTETFCIQGNSRTVWAGLTSHRDAAKESICLQVQGGL
jgi:hypothetical protein